MGARALAIVAAALVACAGPDVQIERIEIIAPQLPGHVRVELVMVNRNGGHGQVQIELRVRNTRSRNVLAAEHALEFNGHQRVELIVDIPAPDGEPDGGYIAEARTLYPD